MGIEQQVYLKSDRRGRGLVLIFCLAPMIVPLLTIGGKLALDDPHVMDWARVLTSSAQASAPPLLPTQLGRLPTRDEFQSSLIFADPSVAVQEFQWMTGQTIVEQAAPMPTTLMPSTLMPAPDVAQTAWDLRRDN
jgi:hypothetical protein